MSLDITCVNKIRVEKYREFETSIFSKVYKAAESLINSTIEENRKKRENGENRECCGEADIFAEGNYICNIIAFTGKRGMGKSSAMLSFAYALKKNEIFDKEKFFVLPKIDMSMVTPNESLLDIVLAYMWDEYEKIDNNSFPKEETITSLKRKFIDVKDSYMRFKKANKKDYEDELYSVGELKSLAKSLQLRNSFSSLVCDFLDKGIDKKSVAPSDKYLVLVIDDLDLVSEKPVEVLEQIKNFLSIPQTIVLTTLDIERGILNKLHELEKQFSGRNYFNDSDERVLEYATDYMAKVIPFNRRIYMPDINEKSNKDNISIDIAQYRQQLGIDYLQDCPERIDYERFCNLLLYRYTGILTDPKMGCLFDERESLRGIVNGLNALDCSIDNSMSLEEKEISVKSWIKKETLVQAEKLNSEVLNNFFLSNCKYPWHRFVDFMVQSIYFFVDKEKYVYDFTTEDTNFDVPLNGVEYSDMLAFFVQVKRKVYINDWNKIKNALWVYSVNAENEVTRNVFTRLLENVLEGVIEREVYLPRVFNFTLHTSGQKVNLSEIDYEILSEIVKCSLFTDVDQLTHQKIQMRKTPSALLVQNKGISSTENKNEAYRDFEVENLVIKISFDNFIENMCNYEDCCRKVIMWISSGIYSDKEHRTRLCNNLNKKIEQRKWSLWKENYKIESVNDLLPLKSLGYMVGLAERVDSSFRKNQTNSFPVIFRQVKDSVYTYMTECESYYYMESDYMKKSDAWKEMFEIAGIESVSLERQQRMINQTLIEKSQVITM